MTDRRRHTHGFARPKRGLDLGDSRSIGHRGKQGPSSNFPCPLCRARAQSLEDTVPDDASSMFIMTVDIQAQALADSVAFETPRERAEHMREHGWVVR